MRFPLASTTIVVVAALTAAGCILPDEMKQLEQDVTKMRRDLDDVKQDQSDALGQLDRIEEQVSMATEQPEAVSRDDFADLTVQVQQVERDLSNVDQRVSDLSGRLQDVAEDATQAREYARTTPVAGNEELAPGDGNSTDPAAISGGEVEYDAAQPDPQALYNTAYSDYSKGNYALAISGFQEYQQKFPDKPDADNALYWVAECRFSQGDFGAAIQGFDEMLSRYGDSDKAASANLKKALAYLEQNDIQRAILQLRYVHGSYSGTDEARIARDKLASLGAPV
jgi:tol-pal system protein YbgF